MELFKLFGTIAVNNSDANNAIDETTGKAKGASEAFGKAAKGMMAATAVVGTATVATAKGLYNMASQTAATGDEIDKMSQKLGLSKEAYQEWDYVMQLSGTEISSMSVGLKTLTNKLDDAKNGSKDAQAMFAELGISMEDIETMSREDLFAKTIQGFQGMADSTERAALANDLFGKSGQELTPLFNTSSEATKQMIEDAHQYGMVMSDEAVSASADFVDSMTKMQGTMSGLKNQIGAELLPSLTDLVGGFTDLIAGNEGAAEAIQTAVSNIVSKLSEGLPKVIEIFSTIAIGLADALPEIISSLAEGILDALPTLLPVLVQVITNIAEALIKLLPQIVQAGIQIIVQLAQGIVAALPTLVPILVEVITEIVQVITDNLPIIIEALIEIVNAIIEALPDIIQALVAALPTIIQAISDGLLASIDTLIQGAIQLFMAIVDAIPVIIPILVNALPEIINGIVTALMNNMQALLNGAIQLYMAFINAIPVLITQLVPMIPDIIDTIIGVLIDNYDVLLAGSIELFLALVEAIPEVIVSLVEALPPIVEAILTGLIEPMGEMFSGAWDGIKNVFKNAGEWFKGIWNNIKESFSAVKDFFKGVFEDAWDMVKKPFEAVGEFFGGVFNKIKEIFTTIGENIGGAVAGAFKSAINWILEKAVGLINGFIGAINGAIKIINKIPGVSISKLDKLDVPEMEEGGVLEKGQVGLLEGNGAEAVVPLEKNRKWISAVAQDMESGFGGKEQNEKLDRLIELNEAILEIIPTLLNGVSIGINQREFGRLVKAVN
ncbi:phage tail protein [Bacillus infantis]|uniref:phage tail protein n=1 Tax=Bacillus infantis TaxID=324767 RepID=UPI003CEA0D7A